MDISDRDGSHPNVLDPVVSHLDISEQGISNRTFRTRTFRTLIFWTRTFGTRILWKRRFAPRRFAPTLVDQDVSHIVISDQDVSDPDFFLTQCIL